MKLEKWLLGVILPSALLATGCGGAPSPKEASAATPAGEVSPPPARPAPRQAGSPATSNPPSNEILSVLSVEHEVDLAAQRDGIVEEILFDQGNRVEKGAVLARLDDREVQAKLDRARAELQVAEDNVKYNESEFKARSAAYRRVQELHKIGLKSDSELEEAEFRAKGAEYDLDSWHAVVNRNQADIHMLELDLEKTRLRAPFDGVVTERYISVGQTVTKDQKCFRISQLGPLEVRFLIPETGGLPPQLGDPIRVVPVTDHQRTFTARIQKVSPVVDAASGSYDVTARLTGPGLKELRPGMAVRVIWKAKEESGGPRKGVS